MKHLIVTVALVLFTISSVAQLPAGFTMSTPMSGLFQPLALEFLPDGRLLVAQKQGWILIAEGPDYTNFDIYMQISNLDQFQERGLMNIVVDPDFDNNGYIYVFYSALTPSKFRVSRFTHQENAGGITSRATLGSEFVVWEDPDPYASCCHYGGGMSIGPDGMMYLTTGEEFNSAQSQDPTQAGGKILRFRLDGTVPDDNPFFDGAGPNHDAVWAYGLRNPFRAWWDLEKDVFYVAEVGGNDQNTASEDIHLGSDSADYGWPYCEGTLCSWPSGQPANFSAPMFSYDHIVPPSFGGSLTGGLVYRGNQFPAAYQNVYFYGDYVQDWIRYLVLDPSGTTVISSNDFMPNGVGLVVDLEVGPDGSLFYADIMGFVKRIEYNSGNQAPICGTVTVSPTSGSSPHQITCDALVSDPEDDVLTYDWEFGDGNNATGNVNGGTGMRSVPTETHTYTINGTNNVRLTVSDAVHSTVCDPVVVNVGAAPVATITDPIDGALFRAGDLIDFVGVGTDPDGTITSANYSWEVQFLHNEHTHPELGPVCCMTSGDFHIPDMGHDFSDSTGFRIILTVTDSDGLVDVDTVHIWPEKVDLTFTSTPSGMNIIIDGIAYQTPFVKDQVIGFRHWIEAPPQCNGTENYGLQAWSDGGTQLHEIVVPANDVSYSATYQSWGICTLPLKLEMKAFLQGPFYEPTADQMLDDLRSNGLVPTLEPYTGIGFTHVGAGGGEQVDSTVFFAEGFNAIVDWVFIELRDKNNSSNVVATRSALMQIDGDIVDLDGASTLSFNAAPDDYFIAIRHRNHLGIMTQSTRLLTFEKTVLDFSNGSVALYGSGAQKDLNGTRLMWSGNATNDGTIKYTGLNNDRDAVLTAIGGSIPTNTENGYMVEDLNMDGAVKYTGADNDRDLILLNIGGVVPSATIQEQLP